MFHHVFKVDWKYEREESNVVGSFIADQENESAELPNVPEKRFERKKAPKITHHRDIRSFFWRIFVVKHKKLSVKT